MGQSKPIDQLAVDFEKVSLLVARFETLRDLAKQATELIQFEAQTIAHGTIQSGIKLKIDRGSSITSITVKIGADKKHWYARFFETGTKPHEIRAKRAKTLGFGGVFFGRSVQHPGMKADPILTKALAIRGQQAANVFNQGIQDIIRDGLASY
jgi:HK97 gp10 family phage protein